MVTVVRNKNGRYQGKVAGSCYRELANGNVEFWHIHKKRYFRMSKAMFEMDFTVEEIRP